MHVYVMQGRFGGHGSILVRFARDSELEDSCVLAGEVRTGEGILIRKDRYGDSSVGVVPIESFLSRVAG